PSFWGQDNYVTVQSPTGDATGTDAQRIALGTGGDGKWEGANGAVESINPFAIAMPTMHRLGAREVTGNLTAPATVNFGEIAPDSSNTKVFSLRNIGNSDVEITGVSISGKGYTHNATNMLLP